MRRATSQAAAAQPRASFQWDAVLRWMATVQAVRFFDIAQCRSDFERSESRRVGLGCTTLNEKSRDTAVIAA
jgi:hypothetical protein